MQRWTGQTPTALLNKLNSKLTKLPRSVRSLVLKGFPDIGHMPALGKTTLVLLAGTPQPLRPALAERTEGVYNSLDCMKYWCEALALLGGAADITSALQEQRLVILQSSPLSICQVSAAKGSTVEQQRTKLKEDLADLVGKASHAGGDRALDILHDMAKSDRHVVFVLLYHKAYWSKADFWKVAEEKGRLVKRRPGTFVCKCSLLGPNFTEEQSHVISAAFTPHSAVSTTAQGTTAAAAAVNAGETGSSAAAAAGVLLAPPPAAAAAGGRSAVVPSDRKRKRTLSTNAAVKPGKLSKASIATAATATASGGDGGAHERKRPRLTAVKAPGTPQGKDKSQAVTINNGAAVPSDTANGMAAAANNDGVNVQPVKKQEIVELDYARAKTVLAECKLDAQRTSGALKDFKGVMTANEEARYQALIDTCNGVLTDAEDKHRTLLNVAEAGDDGPSKLVCIHRALADFCDVVERRVQTAGHRLTTSVMNVCVSVVERILLEYEQMFSSLNTVDLAASALCRTSGVDGRVQNSLTKHRMASAATTLADECRSILSQPDGHSLHQILVAVQRLQVAIAELTSLVQQSSCDACRSFRVVLRK